MSRPDDRDVYRSKVATPPGGVPQTQWHEQPTGVHSEPWLFRALKDLKTDIGTVATKQTAQGEAIARVEGKVETLTAFVPRPKSPSNGVASALVAHQIRSGASWRKWAQRFLGVVIMAAVGWIGKMLVG